jgi:hypothetical protein
MQLGSDVVQTQKVRRVRATRIGRDDVFVAGRDTERGTVAA